MSNTESKNNKQILFKFFSFVTLLAICLTLIITAPGCAAESEEKTEEDEVEQVVRDEGALFFLSYTIGGKSLSHSEVHITRVQKTGTVEEDSAYCPDVYLVSGKIYAVDIYGDKYENSFDCSVNWSSGEWISNGIETKSKNWDKSGS